MALESTARAAARGSVITEPRTRGSLGTIAGASEPKQSAHGPTSKYSCREPRATPVSAHSYPNLRAAMSVEPQTRPRWRTPLPPPPSPFDDAYLDPPFDYI